MKRYQRSTPVLGNLVEIEDVSETDARAELFFDRIDRMEADALAEIAEAVEKARRDILGPYLRGDSDRTRTLEYFIDRWSMAPEQRDLRNEYAIQQLYGLGQASAAYQQQAASRGGLLGNAWFTPYQSGILGGLFR